MNVAPSDFDRFLGHYRAHATLSFDDGYADNLSTALPILEKHGARATVFVTTGFIERTHVPTAWLATCVAHEGERARGPVRELLGDEVTTSQEAFERLEQRLKNMNVATTQYWHQRILAHHRWQAEDLTGQFLDRDQLRELAAHPLITIGAHTQTHPDLRFATRAELVTELNGARRQLAEWLSRPIETFAYPYGATNQRVRRAAAAAGYGRAYVTETPSWRSHIPGYRRLDVPRIDLSGEVRRMHRRDRKAAARAD